MTLEQLIAQLRGQVAAKLENRANMTDELAAIRAKDAVDPADEAKAEQLRTAKTALDGEISALNDRVVSLETELAADQAAQRLQSERTPGAKPPKYDQVARVETEPRVYTAHTAKSGTSFFSDLYRDQTGRGDSQSRDRLARHQREVEVHGENRIQSRGGEYEGLELAGGPQQIRAMTTSSVGSLVPPQYLLELAAPIARAGRPTANVAVHLPLPEQGMSLTVPRGTTGATAGVQASQNTAPSQTDGAWTDLTIPVGTVAGSAKLSRQTLERGGVDVDTLVFTDIAGAHGVAVDGQVLSGTGSAGQVLGLLNTAGITQMSAFTAAVSIPTLYSKLAGAIAAGGGGRYLAPDTVIAHVRRWGWLTSQMDST
ncbi:MAG: phage major capsid protein, partial [Cellulomonas sp.]|nr:phage major capsid protein [Cellulomonas sp.]